MTNARVVRATPARVFDREALNAVRRWRFEPLDAPVTTRRTLAFSPGLAALLATAAVRALTLSTAFDRAGFALAATLAGKPTPVAYPVMPVVVKTPAWPTVVCPPPADAAGQWEVTSSDDALEARFVSASSAEQAGALLGFVLQGKAVSQRQAWVAQVSA